MATHKDEKSGKKSLLDDFNFLEESSEKDGLLEDASLKPPLLFVRPKFEDLKDMLRLYFETKKIF